MCVEFLLHSLNGTNALQYFTLGDMIGVPELSKQSFAYLLYHFDSIAESRALLSQLHIEPLLKLLGHENLNCEAEFQILQIVDHWISDQSDIVSVDNILKLFSCVRFKLLSASNMQSMLSLPFIQESAIISKLVSVLTLKLEGYVELKPCRCPCHKRSNPQLKMEGCQVCRQGGRVMDEDIDHQVHKETSSDRRLREILFLSPCCSKKTESLIRPEKTAEETNECYPPDILDLANELLAKPPRTPPFVPCVVGHLRRAENPSGLSIKFHRVGR